MEIEPRNSKQKHFPKQNRQVKNGNTKQTELKHKPNQNHKTKKKKEEKQARRNERKKETQSIKQNHKTQNKNTVKKEAQNRKESHSDSKYPSPAAWEKVQQLLLMTTWQFNEKNHTNLSSYS